MRRPDVDAYLKDMGNYGAPKANKMFVEKLSAYIDHLEAKLAEKEKGGVVCEVEGCKNPNEGILCEVCKKRTCLKCELEHKHPPDGLRDAAERVVKNRRNGPANLLSAIDALARALEGKG